MSTQHVSRRDMLGAMKLDDDAVGELLTISRAIINMLELLSTEPDVVSPPSGNSQNAFSRRGSSKKHKKKTAAPASATANALLQRVHASVQVDHLTCPSLLPTSLQRTRTPFDKSDVANSRTLRTFHVEPDTADIARCVLYSGEVQRQLQAMFTLAPPPKQPDGAAADAASSGRQQQQHADPEGIVAAPATGIASTPSPAGAGGGAEFSAKLLCRRAGTTTAPSAPRPSNEIMLSVPATRVRHSKGMHPVILTLTPTHLHVRDPLKDFVQKLPWSHLTSASLGTAPGLHAFIGGVSSAKQSLPNISAGPRHGLLWMMAKHEAQQSVLPVGDRKRLNLTSAQALKQSLHCANLQFSGMSVVKDSPVPVDTSRMTPHHINELWRFELVCESEDDFALFCTFLSVVGNHQASQWALPGLQPFTLPATPLDRPPKIATLKLRPTTLPEIDAAVPGGLAAWSSQQQQDGGKSKKASPPATIAFSESFFRAAHTDKYARPVTLRFSTRAELPSGVGASVSSVALQTSELDFCTENHIGRVEYLVIKQLLMGDPLCRWVSVADVLGHMMVPLRAWNIAPAIKMLRFWCEQGWLERVLVLEPGPRKRL